MPITTSLDSERQLTIHTVTGDVTQEELVVTIMQFYKDNPTLYVLWDYRIGSMIHLSKEYIDKHLVELRYLAAKRKGGKTAYVVGRDVDYGIARMFGAYVEIDDLPFKTNVFRTFEEAIEWIDE